MERSRIRVREPVAVPSLVDGAPAAPPIAVPDRSRPPRPRRRARPPPVRPPKRTGPRLNEENAGVLRDFCMGAGAGTPECRRVGLGGRRRPRY